MAPESSLDVFAIILLFVTSKGEALFSRDYKILSAIVIVFITFSSSNTLPDSFLVLLKGGVKSKEISIRHYVAVLDEIYVYPTVDIN